MKTELDDQFISVQTHLARRSEGYRALLLLAHTWRYLWRRGRLTDARKKAIRNEIADTKTRMTGENN